MTHIIDPETRRPIDVETPSVTVVASTATLAEIVAKSVIVAAARGATVTHAFAAFVLICYSDGHYDSIPGTWSPSAEAIASNSARTAA